jgi:hypothetical protein
VIDGVNTYNVSVLIWTLLKYWKQNFKPVLKWADVFLSVYFMAIFFPRLLLPHTQPTSHLFLFVVRWGCMRVNSTKGFLRNCYPFIHTSNIRCHPCLWFRLTSYRVTSLYRLPLEAVLHFCRTWCVSFSPTFLKRTKFYFFVYTQNYQLINLLISRCSGVYNFKDLFYPLLFVRHSLLLWRKILCN